MVTLSLVLKIYINPIINTIIPTSKIFHLGYSDFTLVLTGSFCGGMFGYICGIANDFLGFLFFKIICHAYFLL